MTLIDVVTVIGSIAAVVAAVLAYLQIQMPFLKNVSYTKDQLSFTFATSLLGCEVLSIQLDGAKLILCSVRRTRRRSSQTGLRYLPRRDGASRVFCLLPYWRSFRIHCVARCLA